MGQDSVREKDAQELRARRVLVCAWCRALLGPGPRTGDEVENFGICPRCLHEQLSRAPGAGSALGSGAAGR